MRNYSIGIVLVKDATHGWADIVPKLLIYGPGNYEKGVRKIINRQLGFKRLSELNGFGFAPVAIIMDGVEVNDLDICELGFANVDALTLLLKQLFIEIVWKKSSQESQRLFPAAWEWSTQAIGRKQIHNLSRRKSESDASWYTN